MNEEELRNRFPFLTPERGVDTFSVEHFKFGTTENPSHRVQLEVSQTDGGKVLYLSPSFGESILAVNAAILWASKIWVPRS